MHTPVVTSWTKIIKRFSDSIASCHPQWPVALRDSLLRFRMVPAPCRVMWTTKMAQDWMSSPTQESRLCLMARHEPPTRAHKWACTSLSITTTVKTDGRGSQKNFIFYSFLQPQTPIYSLPDVAVRSNVRKEGPAWGRRKTERMWLSVL